MVESRAQGGTGPSTGGRPPPAVARTATAVNDRGNTPTPTPHAVWAGRHDALGAVISLLLLLCWEGLGGDRIVTSWIASAETGFALRAHPWLVYGMHEGARLLSAALLVMLVIDASRRHGSGPSRSARWLALAAVVACMLTISAIKRMSMTSCPWDVIAFGGQFPYVPHWPWMATDGGPGHCFPSGHASAAFGYFALVFLWRPYGTQRAAWIFGGVCLAGLLLGLTQVLRGAHYMSHVFWTGWICWTVSALAMGRYHAAQTRRQHGRSTDDRPQEFRAT